MDIQLPIVEEIVVTRRVRERESEFHTPISAMTAYTRREERDRCLAAGMDGVLTKPVDRREMAQLVRSTARDPIVSAVGGNMRLLARVSAAFSEQTPPLVASMHQAIANEDAESLFRAAHKLKGSVSNFPTHAVELARDVEELARAGDIASAAALMERLEEALRELEARLQIHA